MTHDISIGIDVDSAEVIRRAVTELHEDPRLQSSHKRIIAISLRVTSK